MNIRALMLAGLLGSTFLAGAALAAENVLTLSTAAKEGNRAAVQSLLNSPVKPNVAGAEGTAALVWAASRNDMEMTDLLLRAGANPKGVNVFTADGRFFVMFARPDLPKIASNNPMTPTPDEAKALAQGTISYFGTYTVDEAKKTITFQIESTSYPNQLGIAQERVVSSLTADELKYSNPTTTTGGKIEVALKRAK